MNIEGWRKLPIEDCMEAIIDYRGKTPRKTSAGIPLITAKIVKSGWLQPFNEFIAEEDFDAWMTRGLPQPGDVVMTTEAPLGEVAHVPTEKVALAQRVITLRGKKGVLSSRFLKFLLQFPEVTDQIRARATGTTVVGIKQSELRKVELPLPPFNEQLFISSLLGTLDDRIENNRRTNRTLEAIARALFAHHFPHDPEDLLPPGWHPSTLGEISAPSRETVQPGEVSGDTPYIGLEHMPRRHIALDEWGVAEGVMSGKFAFREGDILFGKLRPYFHKVGVAPVSGVCSTDILVLRPIAPQWFGLALCHLSSDDLIAYTEANSDGTKMPRTSWQALARYPIALPDNMPPGFNETISAFTAQIRANIIESRTLAALRQTLLPKLLSGEIRVPQAGTLAEARI